MIGGECRAVNLNRSWLHGVNACHAMYRTAASEMRGDSQGRQGSGRATFLQYNMMSACSPLAITFTLSLGLANVNPGVKTSATLGVTQHCVASYTDDRAIPEVNKQGCPDKRHSQGKSWQPLLSSPVLRGVLDR